MAAQAQAHVQTVCDQYLVGLYYYGSLAPVVETRVPSGWRNHLVLHVPLEHEAHLLSVTFWMMKAGTEEVVSFETTRYLADFQIVEQQDMLAGHVCLVLRDLCSHIRWTSVTLPKQPVVLHVDIQFEGLPQNLHFECEPTFYRTNVVAKTHLQPLRITSLLELKNVDESVWLFPGLSPVGTLTRLIRWSQDNTALQRSFLQTADALARLRAIEEVLAARPAVEQLAISQVAIAGAGRVGMDVPAHVGPFRDMDGEDDEVVRPVDLGGRPEPLGFELERTPRTFEPVNALEDPALVHSGIADSPTGGTAASVSTDPTALTADLEEAAVLADWPEIEFNLDLSFDDNLRNFFSSRPDT